MNSLFKFVSDRHHLKSYLVPGSATSTSSCNKLSAAGVSPSQRRLVDLSLLGNPVKMEWKLLVKALCVVWFTLCKQAFTSKMREWFG